MNNFVKNVKKCLVLLFMWILFGTFVLVGAQHSTTSPLITIILSTLGFACMHLGIKYFEKDEENI